MSDTVPTPVPFKGNDKLLFGMIMGVIAFWLFAQTTLNIAPDMQQDLGMEANVMNIAVAITALFSGMFIVVMGGLADRIGRVRIMNLGFILSIVGALMIALTPTGAMSTPFLMLGRAIQGVSDGVERRPLLAPALDVSWWLSGVSTVGARRGRRVPGGWWCR